MPEARRAPIPEPLKRQVRQQCGFGCILCGKPLYHYEHMIEFAVVQEHTLENLALLCAEHHDEKTRGIRTTESIVQARAAPFNLGHPTTSPWQLPEIEEISSSV